MIYFQLANPAIDTWLGRSSSEVYFNERIDTLTQTIVCNVIPKEVQEVITKFSEYRYHRIFLDIFLSSLEGISNWDAVVCAFNKCMSEYQHLIHTLNTGEYKINQAPVYMNKV